MAGGDRRHKREVAALDEALMERLALDYVARYATTRARLSAYLARKLRERGWSGGRTPDVGALAQRMAEAGYIDDAAFAASRAAGLARRGYGRARVGQALVAAGIGEDDRAAAMDEAAGGAWAAALAYARRRRIGPFAAELADRDGARRAIAAMIRAGHDYATARKIVASPPGEVPDSRED